MAPSPFVGRRSAAVVTFALFLSLAGCRSGIDAGALNFPCLYDAGTPREAEEFQCPTDFRCGFDGNCRQRGVPEAFPCAEDADCEGGFTCDVFANLCAAPASNFTLRPAPSGAYRVTRSTSGRKLSSVNAAAPWSFDELSLSLVRDAGLEHLIVSIDVADVAAGVQQVSLETVPLFEEPRDIFERAPTSQDGGRVAENRTLILDQYGLEQLEWAPAFDRVRLAFRPTLGRYEGQQIRSGQGPGALFLTFSDESYSVGRFSVSPQSYGELLLNQGGERLPGVDGGSQAILDMRLLPLCKTPNDCRSLLFAAGAEGLSVALLYGDPEQDFLATEGEGFVYPNNIIGRLPSWSFLDAPGLPHPGCGSDAGSGSGSDSHADDTRGSTNALAERQVGGSEEARGGEGASGSEKDRGGEEARGGEESDRDLDATR